MVILIYGICLEPLQVSVAGASGEMLIHFINTLSGFMCLLVQIATTKSNLR